ncbi:class I SAM-dependent methyltransferase [Campylobacter jejuni]|nr:class I SAM-dependent methyltransferase [Campylobacter jejuni]ECQ7461238.1 class I SAM-dependent methyltransferase [Campylobacter jejuni]ECQ9162214.1 class I SAM-dependent methyltransferase [Campylobacter jejuni]EDP4524847.1 class I SAM-dependent methyltransferase [Campylobacter jejuni]
MKCYLCGSENHFKREGKVRDDESINILECSECGLVFLDKQKTNDEYYKNDSMLSSDFFKYTQREGANLEQQKRIFDIDNSFIIKKRYSFLKRTLIGKKILEFGSGHADFLILAKEVADSVTGIELENVDDIYKQHNIPLYKNLTDIAGEGDFDIIGAFHVLEHLQDPIAILKELSTCLNENGKMIIEVPNADDALLTIYKNKAYMNFIYWSPHLYSYNRNTLTKIAQKAGLTVDYIKCIQKYPLSNTLYWLSKGKPGGHKQWEFLDNFIIQENYEQTLASLGATDTLIAQFSKTNHSN